MSTRDDDDERMEEEEKEEEEESTDDESEDEDQYHQKTMGRNPEENSGNDSESRFHLRLSKLKTFRLHEVNDLSNAHMQVVEHIKMILSINEIEDENESKKKKVRDLRLVKEEEFLTKTQSFNFREYFVEKRGKYRGKREPKFGTITFVYWISRKPQHGQVIPIYAVLNNRFCQAWSMLKLRRRLDFPLAIAKQILDPATIRSVNISYLSNGNIGSDKVKFNNMNKFNTNEIMSKYGIVSGLEAHVDPTSIYGNRFLEIIGYRQSDQDENGEGASKDVDQKIPLVNIQKGQISFYTATIRENTAELLKQHYDFFEFMEKLFNEGISANTANKWKFVDYIKQETDRPTISKLEEEQLKKIFQWIYSEATSTPISPTSKSKENFFDEELQKVKDSSLMHIYQDMFDDGIGIKLIYKRQLIHDFKSTKGRAITIFDVITKAREHFKKKDVDRPSAPKDVRDVFIQYFDFNTYDETRVPFYRMISDHINLSLEPNGKNRPYFQHKGFWFSLTYDTVLESAIKFLDVIKSFEISNQITGPDSFELLEWNTTQSKDSRQCAQFTMDDLIKHCAISTMTDEERCELSTSLRNILTLENRIFVDELGHRNTLVSSFSENVPDGAAYLDLNVNILPTSKFFDKFPSSFKTKKGKYIKRQVINAFRKSGAIKKQHLTDIAGEAKLLEKDIDLFFQGFDESFTILEKINDLSEEKVRYVVVNPYLTTFVWEKIHDKHPDIICPGRLIQFLRMKSYLKEESDYNELYHLSNCPCHSNGWLYVVGDRIFNEENHKIELFDVLCYKGTSRDGYLLHMKKDFNAGSVRGAMSQVRVSHEQVWRAVSCISEDNAFQRLFRASRAKASSGSTHEKLAFSEMQQIGVDEEQFANALLNDRCTFRIVYCPCVARCNLSDLNRYDLQKNILEVAKLRRCDDFMKVNGYVDAIRGRATGKLLDVLNKKDVFIKQLAKYIQDTESLLGKGSTKIVTAETTAGQIYDEICRTISGRSADVSLLNKSFVARHEITELTKLYSFGTKIEVNILQIPSPVLESPKKLDHCICQKEGAKSCMNKQNCICYKEKKLCKKSCYCFKTHSCGNVYGQACQKKLEQYLKPVKKPRLDDNHSGQ